MENINRQHRSSSRYRRIQVITGLLLFCSLTGPLWAPVSPGWCKNNTTLSVIANLSFGTFTSNSAGTVTVAVTGIRTATGGVLLLGGTVRQAAFDITGCADSAFSIILPPDSTLTFGADTMTVTAFTSYPVGSGILDVNGAGTLQFGATLNVAFPQTEGSYTGTYPVEIVIQ